MYRIYYHQSSSDGTHPNRLKTSSHIVVKTHTTAKSRPFRLLLSTYENSVDLRSVSAGKVWPLDMTRNLCIPIKILGSSVVASCACKLILLFSVLFHLVGIIYHLYLFRLRGKYFPLITGNFKPTFFPCSQKRRQYSFKQRQIYRLYCHCSSGRRWVLVFGGSVLCFN
jgi:hypothetical protein